MTSVMQASRDNGTVLGRHLNDPALGAFRRRALDNMAVSGTRKMDTTNAGHPAHDAAPRRVVRHEVLERVLRAGSVPRVCAADAATVRGGASSVATAGKTGARVVRRGVVDMLMLRCEISLACAANDSDNQTLADAEADLHAAEIAEEKQQMIEGFHQRLRTFHVKREIAAMEIDAQLNHAPSSIFASLVAPRDKDTSDDSSPPPCGD
jgi:hypothetical protein